MPASRRMPNAAYIPSTSRPQASCTSGIVAIPDSLDRSEPWDACCRITHSSFLLWTGKSRTRSSIESDILEVDRFALDAPDRRRDPAGELPGLDHTAHQRFDKSIVFG